MSERPEALRLADTIEEDPITTWGYREAAYAAAAAELRRLHAVNQELLEALKRIDKEFRKYGRQHWPEAEKARAVIAKAEGT
jgi:hypothetical protein